MPRKPHPKNAYLEMHDGYYRVTMGVPAPLRGMLGNRLKHSLGTKSLISANVLKVPIVKLFKSRIEQAWETIGGHKRSELQEAVSWAKVLADTGLPGGEAHDHYAEQLRNRVAEIRQKGSRWITEVDEDGEAFEVEVFTPNALENAEKFSAVAHGAATPITLHHDAYMKTLKIKARSLTDDTRALKILLDWCAAREIKPYLERIDIKVAVRFMDELQDFTGLSWATAAKYLGRLNRYWTYLIKRTNLETNPFTGLTIEKPAVDPTEEERSFNDVEVQTLLMGKADPGMRDVMLIAALTGARLDAVIDLRVGECADGWFTFKPQKKEVSARDVPIHPDLRDLVAARVKGKDPEDDFFPDWPAPATKGSMRERSAYFSKRFTKYRRDLGVADVVDGKRRSLVNFHSFRRWFITKGERAGVDGDLLAAIVGHKRSGLTLGRYSEGPEMSKAKRAVAKIKLPPLDGSPITEAQALTPRNRRPSIKAGQSI